MKKKAVIILALMLILSSLAGCSSSDQKDMEAFEERYQKNQELSEEERQAQFDQRVQENLEMLQGEKPQEEKSEEKPQEMPPEPAPEVEDKGPQGPPIIPADEAILLVQNSIPDGYGYITYGDAFATYFLNAQWQYDEYGIEVVFTGEFYRGDTLSKIEISFPVFGNQFVVSSAFVDGELQYNGDSRYVICDIFDYCVDEMGIGCRTLDSFTQGNWVDKETRNIIALEYEGHLRWTVGVLNPVSPEEADLYIMVSENVYERPDKYVTCSVIDCSGTRQRHHIEADGTLTPIGEPELVSGELECSARRGCMTFWNKKEGNDAKFISVRKAVE